MDERDQKKLGSTRWEVDKNRIEEPIKNYLEDILDINISIQDLVPASEEN